MKHKRLLLVFGSLARMVVAAYLTPRLTTPRHRITEGNIEAIKTIMVGSPTTPAPRSVKTGSQCNKTQQKTQLCAGNELISLQIAVQTGYPSICTATDTWRPLARSITRDFFH
jgi:hypothetical protein